MPVRSPDAHVRSGKRLKSRRTGPCDRDAHIYDRHIPMVEELLKKEPLPGPTLWVDPEVKDFYQFTTDSFKLENYQYHPFDHKVPVAI